MTDKSSKNTDVAEGGKNEDLLARFDKSEAMAALSAHDKKFLRREIEENNLDVMAKIRGILDGEDANVAGIRAALKTIEAAIEAKAESVVHEFRRDEKRRTLREKEERSMAAEKPKLDELLGPEPTDPKLLN